MHPIMYHIVFGGKKKGVSMEGYIAYQLPPYCRAGSDASSAAQEASSAVSEPSFLVRPLGGGGNVQAHDEGNSGLQFISPPQSQIPNLIFSFTLLIARRKGALML